jgi:S-(hydroxymethyl)glutathione dehydrogenase/alcohol dehydrogenase
MKVRAAVWEGVGKPIETTELTLADPRPGEVLVRIGASGVCHSDLSVAEGKFPVPTPIVLGHEGAGTVEAVGEGVTRCAVGDRVVLSLIPQCGECYWCAKGQPELCAPGSQSAMTGVQADGTPRFARGDEAVYQFQGLGTFAEAVVVSQHAVVPFTGGTPFDVAALLGCAVMTGVGAAQNTADIATGDTVLVIGCGGVGLNVIQGSRLAGAARIIAIDVALPKLDLATHFGATDTLLSDDGTADAILELTGGLGVDVAFDVVGAATSTQLAMQVVRRGGQVCVVGMTSAETVVPVASTIDLLVHEKKLFGTNYGSSDVRRDVPKLLGQHASGSLLLEDLISARISLDDIEQAFETMRSGHQARSVVVFG